MKKLLILPLLLAVLMSMHFNLSSVPNQDLLGRWLYETQDYKLIMVFKQDGSYTADMNLDDDLVDVVGNYQINDAQELILRDTSGDKACIGDVGKYTYKVEDDKLMLRVVSDDCFGRKNIMSALPYGKKVK